MASHSTADEPHSTPSEPSARSPLTSESPGMTGTTVTPTPALEMSQLPDSSSPASTAPTATAPSTDRPPLDTFETAQSSLPTVADTTAGAQEQPSSTAASDPGLLQPPTRPGAARDRAESAAAIGPATDSSDPNALVHTASVVQAAASGAAAAVLITLLLPSTGTRHPYKIDERYLRRRGVVSEGTSSADVDPYAISVYTLKELIWRDWREEWEARPSSPGSIRLITMGRMLDDKTSLRDCRFSTSSPNVVHMTLKPQDLVDDEENAKLGKNRSRASGDGATRAGCRCCSVM